MFNLSMQHPRWISINLNFTYSFKGIASVVAPLSLTINVGSSDETDEGRCLTRYDDVCLL